MLFLEKMIRKIFEIQENGQYEASYQKGEGVIIHYTKSGEILLENTISNKAVMIMNKDNILMNVNPCDIDFEKVDKLENSENARRLAAMYGFGIEIFNNGVALVWWTLYPDGRYFEDEDGFGGECCNETTVYAFIDTLGNVIIPFQDMDSEDKKRFRTEAEQKVASRRL